MVVTSQSWQSIWEKTIRHSSQCNIKSDLSEMDRLNISAEIWYNNYDCKQNLDDLHKKPEFKAEFNRMGRFITKDSSVLDIGAGFGRLAIPLAKEVRKLTALEPAWPYRNVMKEKAAKEGVRNMEFAQDLWKDFPLNEKYDFVYSTWSGAVRDPASLMKMHEASLGYCALELGASSLKVWDFAGHIYPMIVGEDFRPPGNYLNIITTLYDHGIYANLETWRLDREINYQTMEAAIELWKISLENYTHVTEDAEEKLRRFYQSRMNQDGSYTFRVKGANCMIWWKV